MRIVQIIRSSVAEISCGLLNRYNDAKPVVFGVGDIVEIQASFVAFPLKDGKYKSALTLRSLTLLDGSFTQVCVGV